MVFRKGTARWDFLSGSNEYTNAYFPVGSHNDYVKDDVLHHAIHAYADEDNVYVQVSGGKTSTAMDFVYVLFVDQSEEFSTADGIVTDTYGLKIAKSGFDVKTAYEYQLRFSSQYKILQFYNVSKKTETLGFDRIFASAVDTDVEQGGYVDFTHGLGYAPLALVYGQAGGTGNRLVKLPYMAENSIDTPSTIISYFTDSTRIRVYWYRNSLYSALPVDLPADTLTVKILPFTQSLAV
jgi:hypothetical protein